MTDLELGWLAGLFEGEGSISIIAATKKNRMKHARVQVQLVSTDKDTIERVVAIAGGKVRGPYGPYTTQKMPFYQWGIDNKAAGAFLRLVLPLLGQRRAAKAREALEQEVMK